MRRHAILVFSAAAATIFSGCSGGGGSPGLPATIGNALTVQTNPNHAAPTASPSATPRGPVPAASSVAVPSATPSAVSTGMPPVGPSVMPSATSVPTSTPSPATIATATPTAWATATATATPTLHPTAPPTQRPTATPVPQPTLAAAAEPCVHFSANPMCHTLPASPSVSVKSAAWAALEFQPGRNGFGGFQVSNAVDPFLDSWENAEPLEELVPGSATIAQTIVCNAVSWGPWLCNNTRMQGKVVNLPADMIPEGASDHHFSYDDPSASGEYDFWLAAQPGAPGATMNVGGAGFCQWGGDGTNCSGSTATDIATSLGGVDATALRAAESDPHGTLGVAIASNALCADPSYVYPATSSDGANTNATSACFGNTASGARPPEGTRWFLNKSDADIDASGYAPYVQVILRTLDREHYGGTIVDTNWSGGQGLSMEYRRGNFAFAAAESNIAYGKDVEIPVTTSGLNLASDVVFCTNGTC